MPRPRSERRRPEPVERMLRQLERRVLDDVWLDRLRSTAIGVLAPVLAVKVVDTLSEAVEHVRRYGSDHTDIIVTADYAAGQEWLRRVNSSTVGINCSTAYSDGFRLGLGAEIGISNSRIHAYGPMGLEGLTTRKFVLYGDGQLS